MNKHIKESTTMKEKLFKFLRKNSFTYDELTDAIFNIAMLFIQTLLSIIYIFFPNIFISSFVVLSVLFHCMFILSTLKLNLGMFLIIPYFLVCILEFIPNNYSTHILVVHIVLSIINFVYWAAFNRPQGQICDVDDAI